MNAEMILHKKARLRDQRVVTQEMCGLSAARPSTKGNEKITFTDIQAGMTTTLSVFRFNPLFIQFSFPISLAPSAAAYLGTFSEIKGYYRFIALCRIFRIWNRFSTQKWWKKKRGVVKAMILPSRSQSAETFRPFELVSKLHKLMNNN